MQLIDCGTALGHLVFISKKCFLYNICKIVEGNAFIKEEISPLRLVREAVKKFMDVATLQEVVNLETELATNHDRSGPLPSWELGSQQTNGKVLPSSNSKLQTEIEIIKHLSDQREMSLNSDKTCLFIVNFTLKYQFRPLLQIPGCSQTIDRVLKT